MPPGANQPHPTTLMANRTQRHLLEMSIDLITHSWPGTKSGHRLPEFLKKNPWLDVLT
jgi:hypothetical protein